MPVIRRYKGVSNIILDLPSAAPPYRHSPHDSIRRAAQGSNCAPRVVHSFVHSLVASLPNHVALARWARAVCYFGV